MQLVKSFLLSALLSLSFFTTHADGLSSSDYKKMKLSEDSLIVVADSMYNAYIPEYRSNYCNQFVKQLVRILKTPNSFEYPFDSLSKTVNIIYANDKNFRIFNWVVGVTDVSFRYYGAIQLPSEQLKLYGLNDYTAELGKGLEDSILTNNRWFGALYYNIIDKEIEGKKIYTLIGKNKSLISNRKVLEPLSFTEKGVVFGAPIFDVVSETNPNERINRFIIEYKKEVSASMNWSNEENAIVFDKLVSQMNDPNRKYTFVPSGVYDGFRWANGQWNYVQDLIPAQSFKDGEAPNPKPITSKE